MEKKILYILIALVIAIIIISASVYAFSYFSGIGSKYRSELAGSINLLSESYGGQLAIINAYRNGEISCEEMEERTAILNGMEPENATTAGCYVSVTAVPIFERYLSDIEVSMGAADEESTVSDFEIGMMINAGEIPRSMEPLVIALVRATFAGGTYSQVLTKMYDDDLIFTRDNVTVEFNEIGLEKLSACLLDAAEEGVYLVNENCLKIPEDFEVYDLSDTFGFDIGVDMENQVYHESYIKMHQEMLDSVISELDARADAEGLHEEGRYTESIVKSSLVLSDIFFAEALGCGTMKTRESFNACLNVTNS